jgi:hypothetical protein
MSTYISPACPYCMVFKKLSPSTLNFHHNHNSFHQQSIKQTTINMSAAMGPFLQQLSTLPARSRQGLNNLRQRVFQQGTSAPFPSRPSHSRLYDSVLTSHRRETTQGSQRPANFLRSPPSSLDYCRRWHVYQCRSCASHYAILEACCCVRRFLHCSLRLSSHPHQPPLLFIYILLLVPHLIIPRQLSLIGSCDASLSSALLSGCACLSFVRSVFIILAMEWQDGLGVFVFRATVPISPMNYNKHFTITMCAMLRMVIVKAMQTPSWRLSWSV